MSGDWQDRLNGLSERDKHYALCWIHGFAPEVFDRAVEHVAPKPPRIPEPGLWGVVTDGQGQQYVREAQEARWRWNPLGHSKNVTWDEIENPTLVREGVAA